MRDLDAVDAGQLRDHLELDGAVGQEVERGERVGEDGAGGDPLELLDDVLGPLVALVRELVLRLAAEQMGAEQQVARAERLAFALEDRGDPAAEGGDARAAAARARSRPSRRAVASRTGIGRGEAATATTSSGGTSPRQPLSELGQDGGAIRLGEAVRLVEDDDRALSLASQGRQRLVLGAGQVVVDDEEEQVGPRGQVAGFPLAHRDPLRRSRRARACRSGGRFPRPPRRPGCGSRRAGSCPSRPRSCRRAAQQRVDQRRLARRARAEDDDVKLAPMPAGANRGELLARARPGPTGLPPAG